MPDTPTPETPAELAASIKRLASSYANAVHAWAEHKGPAGATSARLLRTSNDAHDLLHAAIDRLATLAASSTSPIGGWAVEVRGTGERLSVVGIYGGVVFVAAAPAAAERKPFTLQAIRALMSQTFADDSELTDAELTLIRAVERAHGITGDSHE